jgi:translation initiation factor IF-2
MASNFFRIQQFAGGNGMVRKVKSAYSSNGDTRSSKLEIVLKCDVSGTLEAVAASLESLNIPEVDLTIIESGVGNISKSDVLMAQTGSRLVIGFNVDTMPKLDRHIKEHGIEVRLYDTIYRITEDVEKIAKTFKAREPQEKITARAKVIATFKGNRKSTVIGCEVLEGIIELGNNFRVITAMGPAYTGKISSLQIERKNVKTGKAGQQVGIQIPDWNKARVDDLVECFEVAKSEGGGPWRPRSGVFRK